MPEYSMPPFSPELVDAIEAIVESYKARIETAERLSDILFKLFSSDKLKKVVHSIRARAKDPDHLRDKLVRKMLKSFEKDTPFEITPENLFEKINDLAGVRLLHLHTSQFAAIDKVIKELLAEEGFQILEGPEARSWDDEYRAVFKNMGIATVASERMYTSVHYVVDPGKGTKRTAEIQVRTLAEELWGEVDHTINYPHPSDIPTCGEQIKVLARVTSSCTRLVDSIIFALNTGKKP
jgi:putative GTP pyrophosphokinase